MIGTHSDITDRKQAEVRIKQLAVFDQLTSLPNRTLLLDWLQQALLDSARDACYGALIFIDLDNFKTLNDSLGHDIGGTLFSGQDIAVEALLKQADLAMHRSKELGRSMTCFFAPDMESKVLGRASLDKDLRQAISEHQFSLHYQPQVTFDQQLTGAEALLRWHHPTRGMVSPADFISLAEETGLILPLGHWVLATACQQLAAGAGQAGLGHLNLAVNVSTRQFAQTDFVAQVKAVLAQTGADAGRLKLELTEGLFVRNFDQIIATMTELKSRGVGFSMARASVSLS